MRIRDMDKFVPGIIQLIIGVGILITSICLNRFCIDRVIWIMLPIFCGIGNIIMSVEVETEAKRRKRKAEIKAELRKMFGGNDNE